MIRECLLFLLLVILVFHVYAKSKDGPFVFDDIHNIVENPHIQATRLDWQSLKRAAFESPLPTRPIANISFAVNYYFNQLEPKGFRLINVLVHLGNGLLLLLLFKATLLTPPLKKRYGGMHRFMPYAAVAIWIVNPIHTQSVSYIVQRMNLMAAFFCLLTFLLYIYARLAENRGSRRFLSAGSVLAFLLAAGSKENSIALPVFIFLYEWYFFRDLNYQWLKKSFYWPLAIMLFWVVMALVYLDFSPVANILSGYQSRDFTLAERVMTQSRVVIFYIFLFIFPHPSRLNLDHYFPVSTSLLDPPTTLLSILVIIALLTTSVLCARRERLLSFCILWFLGNLLIESSVIGLEMVFEHRTYLPTVLVSMVMVTILYRSVANIRLRRAVLALMMLVGTVWTHDRNIIWSENIALWSDSMKKSPQKARPYVNLGIAYGGLDRFDESIFFLDRAVKLKPDYKKPRFNLALSLVARGDYRRGDYRRAESHAREFLDQSPDDPAALNILAVALANQNRFEEALDNYYRSLQLAPDDEYVHYYISQIMAHTGRIPEAVKHGTEALRLKPDYDEARLHLQRIHRRMEPRKLRIEKPFGESEDGGQRTEDRSR
ncbi:MAG: tetratricopeptide repeat protein [Desulfobulbaceae bacterium]|nr:tetratricopeptide repeat protein [Desulfobulbaceae bacterium]